MCFVMFCLHGRFIDITEMKKFWILGRGLTFIIHNNNAHELCPDILSTTWICANTCNWNRESILESLCITDLCLPMIGILLHILLFAKLWAGILVQILNNTVRTLQAYTRWVGTIYPDNFSDIQRILSNCYFIYCIAGTSTYIFYRCSWQRKCTHQQLLFTHILVFI